MIHFGARSESAVPLWKMDWATYRTKQAWARFERWTARGETLGSRKQAFARYLAARKTLPSVVELSYQGKAPPLHAVPAFDAWYRGKRIDPHHVRADREAMTLRMSMPAWRALDGPVYPGDLPTWLRAVREALAAGHPVPAAVRHDYDRLVRSPQSP